MKKTASAEEKKDIRQLLKEVRELEMAARKNVTGLLSGNYVTSIAGQGMIFHEARKYVEGDPVRQIDWNMTARMNEPHLRVLLDEREREVFIVLDKSPSMHCGWQQHTKIEYAVEMAATLAVSASAARDRVGLILFSDTADEIIMPARGRSNLFRVLSKLVQARQSNPGRVRESDMRSAVHAIERYKNRNFIIFFISDFIDHDVPEDLRYLRARHDVSLLHIYDIIEYASESGLRLSAFSPEGSKNTGSYIPGARVSLESMQRYLEHESRKLHILAGSFATDMAVAPALTRFFHKKRRRLRL